MVPLQWTYILYIPSTWKSSLLTLPRKGKLDHLLCSVCVQVFGQRIRWGYFKIRVSKILCYRKVF